MKKEIFILAFAASLSQLGKASSIADGEKYLMRSSLVSSFQIACSELRYRTLHRFLLTSYFVGRLHASLELSQLRWLV
jgi:hypothetical protein